MIAETLHQLHRIVLERPGTIGEGLSTGSLLPDYGAGPFEFRGKNGSSFDELFEFWRHFRRVGNSVASFDGESRRLIMCQLNLHFKDMGLDHQGYLWLLDRTLTGEYPVYFENSSVTYHAF